MSTGQVCAGMPKREHAMRKEELSKLADNILLLVGGFAFAVWVASVIYMWIILG